MIQIKEQTPEEKREMYMKLSKEELASMLIEANDRLDNALKGNSLQPYVINLNPNNPDEVPFHTTCGCSPANGGGGICGCIMANKMVPNPAKYGPPKTNITTTTNFRFNNGLDED